LGLPDEVWQINFSQLQVDSGLKRVFAISSISTDPVELSQEIAVFMLLTRQADVLKQFGQPGFTRDHLVGKVVHSSEVFPMP